MLRTAIAMGAQNIEQNFFPISAIFSCRFYVKIKWNSLLIFQILLSSKTQIFCIQKCIRSTFFNILAKIKSPMMDCRVPKPFTQTWFHRQMSGYQGFPNSVKVWGEILPVGGRIENFVQENFVVGCWKSEGEWFSIFETSSKLNTTFSKYWISVKIKISMIT